MTEIRFAVFENLLIIKFVLSYLDFGTWTLKKARLPDLVSFSVVNLNSLKAISFKGRFPGCMRIVFYARQLDILEIILWFSFIVMFLRENNVNLSEAKKWFLFPTLSQKEKTFAWYEKRFSHNEQFLSRWDSQRAQQSYYSDK